MRRHAIGFIAIVLLLSAGLLWIWPMADDGSQQVLLAACLRVGVLMAVLWAAYPDVRRIPGWILGAVPVLMALVALRPRLFPYVVPVVLFIAILRPRKRDKTE